MIDHDEANASQKPAFERYSDKYYAYLTFDPI